MDIIIFALARWDAPYSCTAYSLAKEFSKEHRVFYIDNPITLKYYLANRNTPEIQKRKSALLFGINPYTELSTTGPGLINVTPRLTLSINFLPKGKWYNRLSYINDKVLFRALDKLMSDYSIKNGEFIFINSFNPFYLRKFPAFFKPKLYVYQTVDDISQSSHVSKHGPYLEDEAVAKADLTIATSKELRRLKSLISNNSFCIPNAADVSLFQKKGDVKPRPTEIKDIAKPIVIYTGHFDPRVDYDLMLFAARFHTDKVFLIVGPVSTHKPIVDELVGCGNVLFIGKKDISELPAYLYHSQCAIIPFKLNALTKSIYPLKVNEYLAAGIPVVSTAFSEDIQDFKNVIGIATDAQSFCSEIDRVIREESAAKLQERLATAQANTWQNRVEMFWQIFRKVTTT